MRRYLTLSFISLIVTVVCGQQLPDTTFEVFIPQAAFSPNKGPAIWIDEGHNNFHVAQRAFDGFIKLMKQDGYVIERSEATFEKPSSLKGCDILVIANALHESNIGGNWVLPTPSAFTQKEIKTIRDWVFDGGKLLLIADHMPFSGAAYDLGKAFGFEWLNGFAKIQDYFWPPSHFEGIMIPETPVSQGIQKGESINRIASFSGSAFKAPEEATEVLKFLPEHISLQPDTAWRFNDSTPSKSLEGYSQGAIRDYGAGRVAAWGEAGMLATQVIMGDVKAGFNSAYAPQNAQMVLNLMHWLSEVRAYRGPKVKPNPPAQSHVEKEILIANRQMELALADNNMIAVSYVYTDDAVLVGHKHEIKGREAIDAYWRNMEGRCISWKLENIHIEGNEKLAYQRGISNLRYRDVDGKEVVSRVKFTLVWTKNSAGNWKILVDHYSPM